MNESTLLGSVVTTVGALGLVLALAWLVLRALRGRLTGRGPAEAAPLLRVMRQWSIGPRERLVMIEVRGEQCLLGVTAGSVQLLARWPQAEVDTNPGTVPVTPEPSPGSLA